MSLPVEVIGPEGGAFPPVIKALLLDDSTFDRARIRRLGQKTDLALQLDEVSSIAEMKDAVARQVFDLIMIDYRLPQGDGLGVLDYIQHSPLNRDTATIMVTGEADMETAVTAMRNGCHDFLTKDGMTADQLRTAMTTAIGTARHNRELAVQHAHQREVIREGLTAALMDEKVQGTVVSMFRSQVDAALGAQARVGATDDHRDLDVFLATIQDDEDDFIFN
ncbi:response regulator [uncultured Sulfitobacter sp.]|uniref:response regulator n=1 Tax=uncultured Sulfitobacter sp. TaxID=191468 RepID=UPI00262D216A|nr:response regulator [uncultured Sulfitobacter sp.]